VSCEVAGWSDWGDCDIEADAKTRGRTVTISPLNGGVTCPDLEESVTCVVNCKMGQWADWSECDKAVGRRQRSRQIVVVPENGGSPCPAIKVHIYDPNLAGLCLFQKQARTFQNNKLWRDFGS
jgi:hypothetical protein